MAVKSQDVKEINTEDDIAAVRMSVKRIVALLNFSPVNQTKSVTAASELARNVLEHGKGGTATMQLIDDNDRVGIRMIFEDHGPGIPDIAKAMEDGFSTGSGMGLGLAGAKRLMDQFEIESKVDQGTRVAATKWDQRA
jgi:serine/threonine-protein kinase RsbT